MRFKKERIYKRIIISYFESILNAYKDRKKEFYASTYFPSRKQVRPIILAPNEKLFSLLGEPRHLSTISIIKRYIY